MKKNIILAVFTLSFVVITAVLFFMSSVKNSSQSIETTQRVSATKEVKPKAKDNKWMRDLANVGKREYFYPVNDLYVQIDLKPTPVKKIKVVEEKRPKYVYVLYIDKTDSYTLFCIRQVLDKYTLPFIVVKDKDKSTIIIGSEDKKQLRDIVSSLKKININSTIKKVSI